jgi:hypothetical protein
MSDMIIGVCFPPVTCLTSSTEFSLLCPAIEFDMTARPFISLVISDLPECDAIPTSGGGGVPDSAGLAASLSTAAAPSAKSLTSSSSSSLLSMMMTSGKSLEIEEGWEWEI